MTADRHLREGRCPDGGYCHGVSITAGSAPCDPGSCYRVLNAGPLSGVYPEDRWPEEVRAAHRAPAPDFGPPVTAADVDPVEAWLRRARCCGAPQLCGARCMDDEASATEAAVVRRLDEAEVALAAAPAAERQRLVQRVIAGDLLDLSSEDRRRVLAWLEGWS